MSISRVIEVSFGGGSIAYAKVDTAYFYNNGIIFKPTDIDLPASYQVHWADSPQASSTLETIGTAEGAPIPDDLWNRSRVIYGWIYLHPTEDSSVTGYEVRIYKNVRAGLPDGTEPTPAEQSTIDQLISALNGAVEQAEDAQEAIENMSVSATTLAEGSSATVTKTEQDGVVHLEFGIPKGQTGDDGYSPTANVSKSGKTSTITITDKNGTTSAQVEDGTDGIDGISPSVSVTDITGGHRVVITDKDGAKSFDVEDGATGATPNLTIGTVETLDPTDDATATITGTAENPVLNLGIPKGDTGEVTLEDYYKAFPTDTASGAIASFSDGADGIPLKSLVVNIDPVQDLHGYDSPWVAGGGKNKFDQDTVYGEYKQSDGSFLMTGMDGIIVRFYIPQELVGKELTFSAYLKIPSGSTLTNARVAVNVNGTGSSGSFANTSEYTRSVKTFTPVSTDDNVYITYGSNGGQLLQAKDIQLEIGSTATSFAPYENICPISGWTQINVNHSDADMTNPTTITISLGQTVYGGKLDVLSGELVIDMAMVDLGTLAWAKTGSRAFYAAVPYMVKKLSPNLICSLYAYDGGAGTSTSTKDKVICYDWNTLGRVIIFDTSQDYTGGASFKAAMSGVQLVYELAEPITIQLTPNQANSLLGVNNIWADSGDTTAEYRADTKLFIERLTAPDSEDMVADTNITSGQYFMVGNSLYKATANIANGSAIVVGTNCTRKSLSEALNEINA